MTSPFLTNHENELTPLEQAIVESVGVRTSDDLLSLTWNFSNLGEVGVDIPKLSYLASMMTPSAGFARAVQQFGLGVNAPPSFALGATDPPGSSMGPGFIVPMPPRVGAGPKPSGFGVPPPIDLRFPGWKVKDQGSRGTCVAFSVAALREHLAYVSGTLNDLSEQYLFWATKTRTADPAPNSDGTSIVFARDALAGIGICQSTLWPYSGVIMAGNVTHASATNPSVVAQRVALGLKHPATYLRPAGVLGKAIPVLKALTTIRRPVAISLPVFANPMQPKLNNWNTAVGIAYGRVLDPPPMSVYKEGHAVCVTGFIPDFAEPCGGWFIFRNSWGTRLWANSLPAPPPYYSPEPGYGQVSASYVDKYLIEMSNL